jgi:hypothetical protein
LKKNPTSSFQQVPLPAHLTWAVFWHLVRFGDTHEKDKARFELLGKDQTNHHCCNKAGFKDEYHQMAFIKKDSNQPLPPNSTTI